MEEERLPADPDPAKLFEEILEQIEEEDYERCAERALNYLKEFKKSRDCPRATAYLPLAEYFKLFSEAYRTWQISYEYTEIRDRFRLAYRCLLRGEPAMKSSFGEGPAAGLLSVLQHLSEMLCNYTQCENSFINNDPFALRLFSGLALQEERRAIRILREAIGDDATILRLWTWLRGYMIKNRLLHHGLHACARAYMPMFRDHACSATFFWANMRRARKVADALRGPIPQWLRDSYPGRGQPGTVPTPRDADANDTGPRPEDWPLDDLVPSPELYSELNAHIFHIERNFSRLPQRREDPTCLRIRKAKLVLTLSACCEPSIASAVVENPARFEQNLLEGLRPKGWTAGNFRHKQLHDIFETSFGRDRLKILTVDLPLVCVEAFGGRKYPFSTSASISALGVFSVRFVLDAGKLPDAAGLSVEEVRALSSLICPHAGQSKIRVLAPDEGDLPCTKGKLCTPPRGHDCPEVPPCPLGQPEAPSARIPSRIHSSVCVSAALECLDDLARTAAQALVAGTPEEAFLPIHREAARFRPCLDQRVAAILSSERTDTCGGSPPTGDGSQEMDELAARNKAFAEALLKVTQEPRLRPKDRDVLLGILSRIHHCSWGVPYLAHLAEEQLQTIWSAMGGPRHVPGAAQDSDGMESTPASWSINRDTSWFCYLYATAIDVTRPNGYLVQSAAPFDTIVHHPDSPGFVIEQREARASFDDWRSMEMCLAPENNLALVRSHPTDAFYASEYQAFLYFPDDPQFLTDQYEATVELMMRLSVLLRFHIDEVERFSKGISETLRREGGTGGGSTGRLYEDLWQMHQKRVQAAEMQRLIARANMSRYKDHGDLMRLVLLRMKADAGVDLLTRQSDLIDELQQQILNRLELARAEEDKKRTEEDDKRERELNVTVVVLTFISASVGLLTLAQVITEIMKNAGTWGWVDAVNLVASLLFVSVLVLVLVVLRPRKLAGILVDIWKRRGLDDGPEFGSDRVPMAPPAAPARAPHPPRSGR